MGVRFVPGSALVLAAGQHRAVAVMTAKSPFIAFYAAPDEPNAVEIQGLCAGEPLFVIAVMRSAYASGRWGDVVDRLPKEELPAIPRRFRQDVVNGSCSIIEVGQPTRLLVPQEECIGLECDAVWSAEHVESRLSDHYDGRPNVWVESLKVKP